MDLDRKVFDGINIVDFGWSLAGPLSVKYLADYGATVVCIESLQSMMVKETSECYQLSILRSILHDECFDNPLKFFNSILHRFHHERKTFTYFSQDTFSDA